MFRQRPLTSLDGSPPTEGTASASFVQRELLPANPSSAAIPRFGRHTWLLIAQIGCTVVLIAWIVGQIDFQPLVGHFASIRWNAVVLLAGIGLLDRFLTAWKWHVLLLAKNIPLRTSEAFRVQMIASFFGSVLPTAVGMDAVRIYLVSRSTRRTLDVVSASTVDRLLTVGGTFLIAGATIVVSALQRPDRPIVSPVVLPLLLLAGGLLAVGRAQWMARLKPAAQRVLGHRLTALGTSLYWNLHEFRGRRGALAACCAITGGSFAVRILFVQVAAAALAVDIPFADLLLGLPLTWVALMLPLSIGGLGLQETAYIVALGSLAPASAVAISLLDQMTMRGVSLLGAAFWLIGPRSDVHDVRNAPA
jgi:uncharacterized membrane protein YbhN (UPF0104 family)